ncbi:hypothetical protein [Natrinema sp. J7-2]|uniref:hypothetical protein n=1 Tax=Natrinema sp. (strain J7-2) TaxID=406552 RepID=UPI00026D4BE8|nr:hypothetical protein [Natrinema sp. J7-2]AFO58622.1 hypothetical protein NJ7G_3404 [Natrinema sp. J7-2]
MFSGITIERMSGEKDKNRRKVLQLTGIGLAGVASFPKLASAESNNYKQDDRELEEILNALEAEAKKRYGDKNNSEVKPQGLSVWEIATSLFNEYALPIEQCTPNLRFGSQYCVEMSSVDKSSPSCKYSSPSVYKTDVNWKVYNTDILDKELKYELNFWFGFDDNQCLWIGLKDTSSCHDICDIDLPDPRQSVKQGAKDAMNTAEKIVEWVDDRTKPSIGGTPEEVLTIVLAIVIFAIFVRKYLSPA